MEVFVERLAVQIMHNLPIGYGEGDVKICNIIASTFGAFAIDRGMPGRILHGDYKCLFVAVDSELRSSVESPSTFPSLLGP